MIRPSGTWTTYRGRQRRVSGRTDLDTITLQDGLPPHVVRERVQASEVGDVVKVVTRARWRDGTVIVGDHVDDGLVGFVTDDADLAARESLYGDQTSGWRGVARVEDLVDVREDCRVERAGGDG